MGLLWSKSSKSGHVSRKRNIKTTTFFFSNQLILYDINHKINNMFYFNSIYLNMPDSFFFFFSLENVKKKEVTFVHFDF